MHPVRANHLRHIARLAWLVLMFSPIAIAATNGCSQIGSPAVPSSPTALLDIPFATSYQRNGTQAFPVGKVDVAASFTLSYQ